MQLHKERVELAAIVTNAVDTSRPLVEASGHTLDVRLPAEPIYLDGDPVRLAQVLANLLNNAAKYMERGGHIWLAAERRDNTVRLSIRDTGVGIPADALASVFDMFTQVDRSLEKAHGGLGIGLTLVKQLVEMHGGSVEARSDGPGSGAEFIVHLPLAVSSASMHSSTADDTRRADAVKCRVLVADDNRDAAESMGTMLRLLGHEVRTVRDGLQAVEEAAAFRPDIILLDIGMPRLNGYEAARRIRRERWGKDMLLVALTGWGQEEDKRRAAEAGFDRHMTKPVDPRHVEQLLAGLEVDPRSVDRPRMGA
jgi:CheY-like chemotaxis protein/two-component sensor histidine kinase